MPTTHQCRSTTPVIYKTTRSLVAPRTSTLIAVIFQLSMSNYRGDSNVLSCGVTPKQATLIRLTGISNNNNISSSSCSNRNNSSNNRSRASNCRLSAKTSAHPSSNSRTGGPGRSLSLALLRRKLWLDSIKRNATPKLYSTLAPSSVSTWLVSSRKKKFISFHR